MKMDGWETNLTDGLWNSKHQEWKKKGCFKSDLFNCNVFIFSSANEAALRWLTRGERRTVITHITIITIITIITYSSVTDPGFLWWIGKVRTERRYRASPREDWYLFRSSGFTYFPVLLFNHNCKDLLWQQEPIKTQPALWAAWGTTISALSAWNCLVQLRYMFPDQKVPLFHVQAKVL